MHCFDLMLERSAAGPPPSVVVALGDDGFLRTAATGRLLQLAGLENNQARTFDGTECSWGQVHDELATLSLFDPGGRRAALVTAADDLIQSARAQLEKWCSAPADGSLLIMQVQAMPANTKLYKLIEQHGWIVGCGLPTDSPRSKSPSMSKLKQWIAQWASMKHGLKLTASQLTIILEAVGPICGILDQELAKLALYADSSGQLTDQSVRAHVGSWATRTLWEIADAIMDGRTALALEHLERVFSSGEHPAAVLPQLAWSIRRYGQAAQLVLQSRRMERPITADEAVKQAGFWGADLQLAAQRLRRLGLLRSAKIHQWLLELDLKIKGSHSHTDRAIFAIEELCLRLH
ncbi:MAG: DNA polymerase III subunit delta [Pirellulaceae bacterium]|nr:DNA polymerase III subunit delta [Pirellulaceae bacterium]